MTAAAWYAARGTGVVSLILLTVVMVLGVGSRSGRPVFGLPRFAVSLLHRNASLIAIVLIAVHVITLLIDPFAQLHLINVIIPFTAPYRTIWLGLGTVAFDLIVALIVTSLVRDRLGPRAWRLLHWLAYAAWPVAWLHGIGTGTDRGSAWYLGIAIASAGAVAAAIVWRCTSGFTTQGGRRTPRRVHEALVAPQRQSATTYRGGAR